VDPVLRVELSIDDPELAERVRDILTAGRGFVVLAGDDAGEAEVLVTDAVEELAEAEQTVPAVVVADGDPIVALRMGAAAALAPDVGADALRAALRAAAAGLTAVSAGLARRLLDPSGGSETEGEEDTPAAGLTPREMQVLQLLAEGASNKVIARRLGITPHTVKFHVAAVAGKLGATGRTDAVAKAMRLGLVMV
jgi:DNA-binding NarL/FixJ family response regulator